MLRFTSIYMFDISVLIMVLSENHKMCVCLCGLITYNTGDCEKHTVQYCYHSRVILYKLANTHKAGGPQLNGHHLTFTEMFMSPQSQFTTPV